MSVEGGPYNTRAYILTIFNDPLVHFDNALYEVWCDDTCEDGKPHKHQVVYFKTPVAFNTIKKSYPTAHIESVKSVYGAIHYIKDNKNGRKTNIEELGKVPIDRRPVTIKELMEVEDPDVLDWRQRKVWMQIKNVPKKIKLSEWKKIHEIDIDIEDWKK